MHKQLPSWQLIHQSLQQNIAVMLMYVLESRGSSPGRQGFMMVVNANAAMSGSLGGGIMEHKFVELAKTKLSATATEISVHQQVHDKTAARNQSGMICSGEQTIFLYSVKKEEAPVVQLIITALEQQQKASLELSPAGIRFTTGAPTHNYTLQLTGTAGFIFTEKIGYKNELYIIGGGHCALALSQLMSGMDFYIRLFDNREGLNTMDANCFVHEKRTVADYAELSSLVSPAGNSFAVIMTVGYRTDEAALKALQGKPFTYLGLLGSKNKIAKMLEQLTAGGMDEGWLRNIYAPVGIPIKSQTPEEIAVSIAAEIISVKNKLL